VTSPVVLHSRLPVTAYDLGYGLAQQQQHEPPPPPKDIPNTRAGFRDEVDRNNEKIIANQKQTIARLSEENGFLKKSHDRLQESEKTLAKTQNLLVTEKKTAQQLRSYTNQMESDLQNQTKILNDLLVKHKELEDKGKRQSSDIKRLTKENRSLSEALQESVRNELRWKDDHGKVKMENTKLVSEVKNLKGERDILLDIWSTLESPVDWEMQKGRGGGGGGKRATYRKSPQFIYPQLAKEMRQRASQPNIQARVLSRIQAKQIRRMTEKPGAGVVDNLDRLRPKLLAIGGKMELSEKVTSLEELVREQTALIEELESIIVEEQQDRLRYDGNEEGTGNFAIPSSIGTSMIAEGDSLRSRP